MKAKHTPGKWQIFWGNYTHAATINKDTGTRICTINSGQYNAKEYEANAILIASAPQMLKTLVKAKQELEFQELKETKIYVEICNTIKQATKSKYD
jgi:hypothetical protein